MPKNNKLLNELLELINEADSDFKHFAISTPKLKATLWWEYKLIPATFDIDFDFKVVFDYKQIKKDFIDKNNNEKNLSIDIEYDDIENESANEKFDLYLKQEFSDRAIRKKINSASGLNEFYKKLGFKLQYISFEEIERINLKLLSKKNKFHFNYQFTFESLYKDKKYDRKEIKEIFKKIVEKTANTIFKDTKYYKIKRS